ncbi:hypothetical protein C4D60_Mb10t10140 [Musa balbisiana]|uniref:Uncharacterized protein n=1 Tax=Musa balbisiana TaxID=52838 RepID=A0A4S8IVZ5_MUSBA|nr:hypothetical protein C4D60_Mb10t10140 [Musa balbisiana]
MVVEAIAAKEEEEEQKKGEVEELHLCQFHATLHAEGTEDEPCKAKKQGASFCGLVENNMERRKA